jgi:uncharacterized radical SAM superfamily Fe-S cluster-containing enzyme
MSANIKRLLANKTYCALPFVHRHRNLDGQNYLCCISATDPSTIITDSTHRKDIQDKILQGIPVKECNRCYAWEKDNAVSPRVKETIELLRDPVIQKNLEESAVNPDLARPLSYDIRFDNRCNLACVGCGPWASTLWAKKTDIKTVKIVDYRLNELEQIASSQRVYFAGGEPLINEQVYNLLCQISKTTTPPAVIINSNIASIKPKFFEVLGQIKNLSITVSIDGYGKVNAYHRWPSQWNKFYSNLEQLQNMGIYISWNTVIDAVSVWGLKDLLKIETLTENWNLRILDQPEALCLQHLPDGLKRAAQDQLDALGDSRFAKHSLVFNSRLNLARQRLNEPGDPKILSEYISYLDHQRNLNHETYLGVKLT